jgi:hypothetical protein
MALHPNFPESPYGILDPALRCFPADERATARFVCRGFFLDILNHARNREGRVSQMKACPWSGISTYPRNRKPNFPRDSSVAAATRTHSEAKREQTLGGD